MLKTKAREISHQNHMAHHETAKMIPLHYSRHTIFGRVERGIKKENEFVSFIYHVILYSICFCHFQTQMLRAVVAKLKLELNLEFYIVSTYDITT